ncbi:uncharacterized protein TRIADDRAFT_64091 [Trichoplax adhaerens]|uniref:G-protein coupled receptors family 3 profile domain-containing protein n=1 Tax=Trichoplax adhaerens TaxID=10228 RepID=B3S175_TRIAD|nr:hypothetical protein TRIADDRAFT_64091 [Trichoplax adhaerens]EDV23193.1 hypothetical protein TRIADDRAFT_64091 [Trichoplax adhaerens]|eukprot:XP_002114103.1 hypothetical protein TRIADDRAFT_64091 [Trichoplax adhaerens]
MYKISGGATAANLVTGSNFPYFFSSNINDVSLNIVRLEFIQRYQWQRIAVIMQTTSSLYLSGGQDFVKGLHDKNFTVVAEESFATNPERSVESLQNKDARIVFIFSDVRNAANILCKAYKLGMYGENYAYLLLNIYFPSWIDISASLTNCTSDQLWTVARNYFTFAPFFGYRSNPTIVSGRTYKQHLEDYRKFTAQYDPVDGYNRAVYDSVYALALALNKTEERLRSYNMSLSDFHYNNTFIFNILFKALKETQFLGASGPFRFYSRSRIGNVDIIQYQNISGSFKEVTIGNYLGANSNIVLMKEKIIWPGGKIPSDHVEIKTEKVPISYQTFLIFLILSVIGIAVTVTFLLFNIAFRLERVIKMSSPKINNLFLLGCILCYVSVVIHGSEAINYQSLPALQVICTARIWTLIIGFTLAFGSLFSKMWRVYKIFTNKTAKSVIIRDRQLFSITVILALIDLVLLTLWQIIDPLVPTWQVVNLTTMRTQSNILIRESYLICTCSNITIWIGITLAYKFVVLIFGAFLSWETRSVNIPALNDSYHVGLSIYNVVIICTIGFLINILVPVTPQTAFVVTGTFIIFCTTSIVCFIFFPKVKSKLNPTVTYGLSRRIYPEAAGEIRSKIPETLGSE